MTRPSYNAGPLRVRRLRHGTCRGAVAPQPGLGGLAERADQAGAVSAKLALYLPHRPAGWLAGSGWLAGCQGWLRLAQAAEAGRPRLAQWLAQWRAGGGAWWSAWWLPPGKEGGGRGLRLGLSLL